MYHGDELSGLRTLRAYPRAWRTAADRETDMVRLAREYGADPRLRTLALRVLVAAGAADSHRPDRVAPALAEWVRAHIGYVREAGEQLETPYYTLREGAADCDGHAILLAALLTSVGAGWHFISWGRDFEHFEHVTTAATLGGGRILNLDTTERFPFGWSPPGWVSRVGAGLPSVGGALAGLSWEDFNPVRWGAAAYDAGADLVEAAWDATGGALLDLTRELADILTDCIADPSECPSRIVDAVVALARRSVGDIAPTLADWARRPDTWYRLAVTAAACSVPPACAAALSVWATGEAGRVVTLAALPGFPDVAWDSASAATRDYLTAQLAAGIGRGTFDSARADVERRGRELVGGGLDALVRRLPPAQQIEARAAQRQARTAQAQLVEVVAREQSAQMTRLLDAAGLGVARVSGKYAPAVLAAAARAGRWVGVDPAVDFPLLYHVESGRVEAPPPGQFARPELAVAAARLAISRPPPSTGSGVPWLLLGGAAAATLHAYRRRRGR